MEPLPIKEQIKILRESLRTSSINAMCLSISRTACILGYYISWHHVTDIIPTFNHNAYIRFYPNVKAVQKRIEEPYWDSPTIFGNLRRRWFIRHLIKELKKQL